MPALPSILITIGLLSLFHAAYSAHEHSHITHHHLHHSTSLPIDITIETLLSLLSTLLGLVLNTAPLQPISWSIWAGKIEKDGGGENPFRTLEDRVGFMDIRAKRKDFADWVREDGGGGVKEVN